jgi:predicted enzyme related to lactoylglutathione lyase
MANRVTHFEIHAAEPERAIKFYTELFGWKITKWDGPMDYWLVDTGSDDERGINGAILPRGGDNPQVGSQPVGAVITVDVESVDDMLAKVKELNATIALDKMEVPGIGTVFYAIDPAGNVFGCLESTKRS